MNSFKKGLRKLKMKDKVFYRVSFVLFFCRKRTKEAFFHVKLGYKIFTHATWKLEF